MKCFPVHSQSEKSFIKWAGEESVQQILMNQCQAENSTTETEPENTRHIMRSMKEQYQQSVRAANDITIYFSVNGNSALFLIPHRKWNSLGGSGKNLTIPNGFPQKQTWG